MIVCKQCNEEKLEGEFYWRKSGKIKAFVCIICYSTIQKEKYLKNKDLYSEKSKAYYLNNKEKILNNVKEYRKKNIDKINEYQKKYQEKKIDVLIEYRTKYYKKNKERLSANIKQYSFGNKKIISDRRKKYYIFNKTQILLKNAEYYKNNKAKIIQRNNKYCSNKSNTDLNYKLRKLISRSVLRYLKINNSNKNNKSITKYLPYSFNDLKFYLEKQFESWMSWSNHGIYKLSWDDNNQNTWFWTIDHIVPQSDLPYSSMEDENFKKCWALENLRPLSAKQNLLDGATRARHIKKG